MNNIVYVAVACLVLGSTCVLAQPDTEIRLFEAYSGVWETDFESLATRFSKAGKSAKTIDNHCWGDGAYYVCRQIADKVPGLLLVFVRNAKDGGYLIHAIPGDGGKPSSQPLLVKGNVWTFPWQSKEEGKTVFFRVVNTFVDPDTIEYRREYSEDKAQWTVMERGMERRQGAATAVK